MMQAADLPPVVATVPAGRPAEVVVVSRDARSDILASRDTPLPLVKARRTEDAVLRQTLFLTSTLIVVRPATGAGEQTVRWTYEPYLQRQLCFTSITGQFSCALAEVEELTEKASGEAPLPTAPDPAAVGPATTSPAAPASSAAADDARTAVVAVLRTRSEALFDDDRRLKLDPVLKAAGVGVRPTRVSAASVSRRPANQQP